ncbi:MAG: arginase family protein [Promethearchaeota archaeon]
MRYKDIKKNGIHNSNKENVINNNREDETPSKDIYFLNFFNTFYRDLSELNGQTDFIILGMPYNLGGTQLRGDTEDSPQILRTYSNEVGIVGLNGTDLNSVEIIDLGDLNKASTIKDFNEEVYLKEVREIFLILKERSYKAIPLFIGGDHLITYFILKAYSSISLLMAPENAPIATSKNLGDNLGVGEERDGQIEKHGKDPLYSPSANDYNSPYIFIFDAHLDFYDEWEGNKYSHCTVTKRVAELGNIKSNNILVIGVRDIDLPEKDLANKYGLKYLTGYEIYKKANKKRVNYAEIINKFIRDRTIGTEIIEGGKMDEENNGKNNRKNISKLKGVKPRAYISIDLDVFDPSQAPATGYPIPGGIRFNDMLDVFEYITRQFNIIGIDLVEYAPNLDGKDMRTAFFCAKLLLEIMMIIKKSDENL